MRPWASGTVPTQGAVMRMKGAKLGLMFSCTHVGAWVQIRAPRLNGAIVSAFFVPRGERPSFTVSGSQSILSA